MVTRLLAAALLLNALDAKSANYESPKRAISRALWRHKRTERQSLPPFLIRQGLKNIKAMFTRLLLELAEMELWPAFV